jgi:deazaflavin-dependent oxidoreductase (nitroreductase family)
MKKIPRPRGVLKVFLGAPLILSRLGLSRLLGNRFVIITHLGRRTGRVYRTPVEVVRYEPVARAWTVAAAWGSPPAWYLNISARPALAIEAAGHLLPRPEQQTLHSSDAARVLGEYVVKHRVAARVIARLLGWPSPASPGSIETITSVVPLVRFSVPHASA